MKKLEIADFANDAFYEKEAKKSENREDMKAIFVILTIMVFIFIVGLIEGTL